MTGYKFNKTQFDKFLKDNKLSKTAFCKQAKIGLKTLNLVVSGNKNFRISALFKIARAMNVQIYTLFEE